MDLEKAVKAATLLKEVDFLRDIIDIIKDLRTDMKKSLSDEYETTTVYLYTRWLPTLIDKAVEEMENIQERIKEL